MNRFRFVLLTIRKAKWFNRARHKGGTHMGDQMRRALEETAKAVEKNTPKVEQKLLEAGVETSLAVVYSAAKYYEALDKLAKE
jgi:hypothetical protein